MQRRVGRPGGQLSGLALNLFAERSFQKAVKARRPGCRVGIMAQRSLARD